MKTTKVTTDRDNAVATAEPSSARYSLLKAILNGSERSEAEAPHIAKEPKAPSMNTAPYMGEILDTCHPTLLGRARVRWRAFDTVIERWLPTLHGLSLRVGDRVLVQQATGGLEPVVLGVVDGFEPRPERPLTATATMTLLRDETIRIVSEEGEPLLEIRRDETGPVVRLPSGEGNIEVKGKLKISADTLELSATRGDAKIDARDNVVVKGEMIRLN